VDRLKRDELLDKAAELYPDQVIEVVNDSGAAVHVVDKPVDYVMNEQELNEVDARQCMREQGVDPESEYMIVNEMVEFDDPVHWRWIGCEDAAEAAYTLTRLLMQFADGDLRTRVEQLVSNE